MKTTSIKNILPIAFLTAMLLSALTASAAAIDDPQLNTGISLVKMGYYKDGAAILKKVIGKYPDNAEANFYLGMALNRTTANKEAESYLKHSLMENPENPALNYELGLHYFEKNIPGEAGDYFEQVILLEPQSDLAVKAKEYLRKMAERQQEKNWQLALFAGGQYDSNVILNGTGLPLPAGYSGKSDWSAIINLKGAYSPLKSAESEVAISYSLYQSLHSSLKSFDITQNLAELAAVHALTPDLRLKGTYSFEYLLLDGKEYDIANSLAPSLIYKSSLGTTTVDYRYRYTLYRNSPQFTSNSDRNGDNQLFGLSHIVPLAESVAAWLLYSHDIERTRKSEWDYRGDRLLAGLRSALPLGLVGDVSGEVYWKNYGAEDPLYQQTRRRDTQYSASVSLIKNFTAQYSLSLSEVFSRNVSNIAEFKYDRSITTLLLNARF